MRSVGEVASPLGQGVARQVRAAPWEFASPRRTSPEARGNFGGGARAAHVSTRLASGRRRMHTAPLPLARDQPVLEVIQPQVGPGYDRAGKTQAAMPFAALRKIETQPGWPFGIDVRKSAAAR